MDRRHPVERDHDRPFPIGAHYVTLRADDGWIDPLAEPERYARRYSEYDPDGSRHGAFFAAGPLAQAIAVIPVAGVIAGLLNAIVAAWIVLGSLGHTGYYGYRDASRYRNPETPSGDFSALWRDSPPLCVGVVCAVVGMHVAALLII